MGVDDVLCSLITGGEVGVVVGEEFQIGFQLVNELFGQGLMGIYSVLYLIKQDIRLKLAKRLD